ncbi:hypothetical protein [Hypericibacter sp.]|uniref:hypothetical protein n=1 Tax=Hypericibacter sp. TaxID=2705401 RepID=UPI003D6D687D
MARRKTYPVKLTASQLGTLFAVVSARRSDAAVALRLDDGRLTIEQKVDAAMTVSGYAAILDAIDMAAPELADLRVR